MEVLTTVDRTRDSSLLRRDTFFWTDLESPSDQELAALGELLGLHPLAVEDTTEFGQPAKLDEYGDHVLLVFYSARECPPGPDPGQPYFEPVEVHLYISGEFLVTVRRTPLASLDELRERVGGQAAVREGDLLYMVLNALTAAVQRITVRIEDHVDALEADVLDRVRHEHGQRIYRLKQDVRDLQRRIAGQRDRFDADAEAILALPGFEPARRRYLADVRDGLVQAAGELGRQTEDLHALTSTYFNATSQRLNTTVTRLTVLATFFVVWTLVTSFFGQNFGWLVRAIDSRADFLIYGVGSLVLSTAIVAALLWWRRDDLA